MTFAMPSTCNGCATASLIAAVDALIMRTLSDPNSYVEAINTHLATAGGKRLRATMVLLAGSYGAAEHSNAAVRIAAGVELIHLASLIHDDVIDHADRRRGRPAVHRAWGIPHAAFSGAYLLSRAAELINGIGDAAIRHALTLTVSAVCQGQIAETVRRGDCDMTPAEYGRIVRRKTGRLFAFAAYAGAVAVQAGAAVAVTLRRFGEAFGVLLQLVDDLNDVIDGDPEGKPTATDVRRGVFSAPIVFACRGDSEDAVTLRALLREPPLEGERLERALTLVRNRAALGAARRAAARVAERAMVTLDDLPACDATAQLRALVLDRLVVAQRGSEPLP